MHVKELENIIVGDIGAMELSEYDFMNEIAGIISDFEDVDSACDEVLDVIKSENVATILEEAVLERLYNLIRYGE